MVERIWATNFQFPGGACCRQRWAARDAAAGVMQAAWAGGSDKPEQTRVRVGFIPLTDCAPLAIAAAKGFDQNMASPVASKEASWAAVRDKLVAGELDAAHILYGLLYGLELGIASKPQAMANLMTLNRNGGRLPSPASCRRKG